MYLLRQGGSGLSISLVIGTTTYDEIECVHVCVWVRVYTYKNAFVYKP